MLEIRRQIHPEIKTIRELMKDMLKQLDAMLQGHVNPE